MLPSLNLIASTPPMGWHSWNTFGNNIRELVVRETADAPISTGLKDYGDKYIALSEGLRRPASKPAVDTPRHLRPWQVCTWRTPVLALAGSARECRCDIPTPLT